MFPVIRCLLLLLDCFILGFIGQRQNISFDFASLGADRLHIGFAAWKAGPPQ